MFYIGCNQAIHPTDKSLSGNNIFSIICVYLFVVFYSFGWGPIPFILSSECSPNHGKFNLFSAFSFKISPPDLLIYSPFARHGSLTHDTMAL